MCTICLSLGEADSGESAGFLLFHLLLFGALDWNSLDSCTFTAYLPASVIAKYGGFARQPVISNLLVPFLSGVQFSFWVFPVSLLSKAPQAAVEEEDLRHGHLSVACNDDISISSGDVGYWNHNVRVGSSVLNGWIFGPFCELNIHSLWWLQECANIHQSRNLWVCALPGRCWFYSFGAFSSPLPFWLSDFNKPTTRLPLGQAYEWNSVRL